MCFFQPWMSLPVNYFLKYRNVYKWRRGIEFDMKSRIRSVFGSCRSFMANLHVFLLICAACARRIELKGPVQMGLRLRVRDAREMPAIQVVSLTCAIPQTIEE